MWGRFVQVIVTNRDDPTKQQIFQHHKIDFEIRSTIGWAADTATISLTNLSVEEMKFLQSKEFGDMDIEVRAGYLDQYDQGGIDKSNQPNNVQVNASNPQGGSSTINNTHTLFSGVITNAVGFKRAPEHIFTMFCLSKAAFGGTTFKQMRAIAPNSTLRGAIVYMCEDYGYGTVRQFGIDGDLLETVLLRGRTFHDSFIKEFTDLLGEYNLQFRITTGEVQIFPDTYGDRDAVGRMAKDRAPVALDANSVIGNPQAGIATFRVNTFINSDIQPGMVLDVSPLLGEELLVNGVVDVQNSGKLLLNYSQSAFRFAMSDLYLIQEVVHHGSSHELTFMTSISAILGGATAMGASELSWQDAYAASGMALEG
jgi:hypothetical protein